MLSRKIPLVSRLKGLKDTRQLLENPLDILKSYTDEVGRTFVYHFGGIQKVLVSSDAEIIQHVLKENHLNYEKSEIQTKHMVEYLGAGLLSDNWEKWRPKRRLMQKGFKVVDLDSQSQRMQLALDEYLPSFNAEIKNGSLDLSLELRKFVFSMTAKSLLGVTMPIKDICQISSTISKVQSFMVRQVFQPYLNLWFKVSGQVALHQKMRQEGDQILLGHIMARMKDKSNDKNDLLSVLISMQKRGAVDSLTIEQVLAEAMQFLVAGHETSSNALTWIFSLLSQHPTYSKIILDEFNEKLGSRNVVYSDLTSLPRTMAIIDEALRLYPPFWMLDRVALKNDRVGEIDILAGDKIMCFIYGLHRDPLLWEEPDSFIPERFTGDKRQQKDLIHIPFGAGPRRCIGEHFARVQIMIVLQSLLQRYKFDYSTEQPLIMHPRFTLSRKNGLFVHVRRTKHAKKT